MVQGVCGDAVRAARDELRSSQGENMSALRGGLVALVAEGILAAPAMAWTWGTRLAAAGGEVGEGVPID
jgi:hypothetical protein